MAEVVVGEVLHLDLVGRAGETRRVRRRNNRVGEFPDAADRILEAAVTVDHDFDVFAGRFKEAGVQLGDERIGVAREELDLFFGGFVGAEQTVVFVIAAAVDGAGEDIVERVEAFGTGGGQTALGALARMDVAADDVFGVVQDVGGVVGEDDLHVVAEALVVFDVVNTGETVDGRTEGLAEFFFGEAVGVGVDALFIEQVGVDQLVADFVRRVGELDDQFFAAFGKRRKTNGKTVAAHDRENKADRVGAELRLGVFGDLCGRRVVALGARNDGFGHADDVTVFDGEFFLGRGGENVVADHFGQRVAFAEHGHDNAAGCDTGHTHKNQSFRIATRFSCKSGGIVLV